ncbi:MAG TPA: hypothetical protein VGP46_05130 [Acidimicrobiales bacterium]|nr:hypothetical protein [Acidimicrobiales bacterium]
MAPLVVLLEPLEDVGACVVVVVVELVVDEVAEAALDVEDSGLDVEDDAGVELAELDLLVAELEVGAVAATRFAGDFRTSGWLVTRSALAVPGISTAQIAPTTPVPRTAVSVIEAVCVLTRRLARSKALIRWRLSLAGDICCFLSSLRLSQRHQPGYLVIAT